MALTVAGETIALNGTTGTITLSGADLTAYPAASYGTVANAAAVGITSVTGDLTTLFAAGNVNATTYNFGTGVVSGTDVVDAILKYTGITTYIASSHGDTVTLSAAAQNVTGGAGNDTVAFAALTPTGTIALAGGTNHFTATVGHDLSGATITATGGTADLTLSADGPEILNTAEYNLFNATGITFTGTAGPSHDAIVFSNAGTVTANSNVLNYALTAAGAEVIHGLATTATVTDSAAGVTTTALTVDQASAGTALTVAFSGANDTITTLTEGGASGSSYYDAVKVTINNTATSGTSTITTLTDGYTGTKATTTLAVTDVSGATTTIGTISDTALTTVNLGSTVGTVNIGSGTALTQSLTVTFGSGTDTLFDSNSAVTATLGTGTDVIHGLATTATVTDSAAGVTTTALTVDQASAGTALTVGFSGANDTITTLTEGGASGSSYYDAVKVTINNAATSGTSTITTLTDGYLGTLTTTTLAVTDVSGATTTIGAVNDSALTTVNLGSTVGTVNIGPGTALTQNLTVTFGSGTDTLFDSNSAVTATLGTGTDVIHGLATTATVTDSAAGVTTTALTVDQASAGTALTVGFSGANDTITTLTEGGTLNLAYDAATVTINNTATSGTSTITILTDGYFGTLTTTTLAVTDVSGATTTIGAVNDSALTTVNLGSTVGTVNIGSGTALTQNLTVTLGSGTDTLHIGNAADNVTGGSGADTLVLAAASYTGSFTDSVGGANVLDVTNNGATNISSATISSTGTVGLKFDGTAAQNITMTTAEYTGFHTITVGSGGAAAATNTVTLTTAATVTDNVSVSNYVLGNFTNSFTVANNAADNVTGGTGNDTVNLGSLTPTGTIALAGGTNHVTAIVGHDLSGATITATGGTADLTLSADGTETLNTAEYNLFNATGITFTGTSGPSHDTIVFSNAGTVAANANVGNYVLANGTNSFTVLNNTADNVTGGSGVDTLVLAAASYTGSFTDSVGGANVLDVTNNGATDISSATISSTGTVGLKFDGTAAQNITMTTAEYTGFNTITVGSGGAAAATNTVTLTTVATVTDNVSVSNYVLGNFTNSFTVANNAADNVTGGTGNDTVNLGSLTPTGTIALAGGTNHVTATVGHDLSGATITATGGTADLTLSADGTETLNTAEYNLFNATGITFTGTSGPSNDTIVFSNAGTVTTNIT